jgi:anaerobic magnesium-protoporphyrin IX monomethyl ester cyclase
MSKNIILFRPSTFKEEYFGSQPNFKIVGPPFGLLYIAAPLVERGYQVKIIDELFDLNYKADLKNDLSQALCVGISAMTGEQVKRGLDFAKLVKSSSQVPVVWGGLHATMLPQETLQDENLDIVVQGEGEETFLEIVQALEQNKPLEGIKGCLYKDQGAIVVNPPRENIDLNNIPPLPFHLLKMENYIFKYLLSPQLDRAFMLCQSRGCVHDCKFCTTARLYRNKWRTKKAGQVAKEIKDLIETYHINSLIFRDDNFFGDKGWVSDFCREILQADLNFKWYANCRIDYWNSFDDDFINLLLKAGLVFLGFGIESGSQRILDIINKGLTLKEILQAHLKIEKYPLTAQYFFMSGIPQENDADTMKTVKLIYQLVRSGRHIISLTFYSSYPGIPLFEERKDTENYIPISLWQWGEWDYRATKRFIPFFPMQRAAQGLKLSLKQNLKEDTPYYKSKHYKFIISIARLVDALYFYRKARNWFRFRLFLIGNLKWGWTAGFSWDIKFLQLVSKLKRLIKRSFLPV